MGGAAPAERKDEEAFLGDRKVFIRRTGPNAGIAAVWQRVRLEEAKGHLYEIDGSIGIAAQGYQQLNRIAGLSILTPPRLTLPDGKVVVNPFPIVDPDTRQISQVWCHKIAVGRGPTGNLVVSMATLLYDVNVYLLEEVYKKFKRDAKVGRLVLHAAITDEDRLKYLPMRVTPEITLLADPTHPDVILSLGNYVQRIKFGERLAQTICERNALRHHPALTFSKVPTSGSPKSRWTELPVIGWTHNLTHDELIELGRRASEGDDVAADVIDTRAEATDEDEVGAVSDVGEEGSGGPDIEPSRSLPESTGQTLNDLLPPVQAPNQQPDPARRRDSKGKGGPVL